MTTMTTGAMEQALIEAARAFAARTDSFARGKAETCMDLARRLRKFGDFASDKQADFAAKLIEWAKPREAAPKAEPKAEPTVVAMPELTRAIKGFAKVTIGAVVFTRDTDGDRWVLWGDELVGRFESGFVKLFARRIANLGLTNEAVANTLSKIEQNPGKAIVDHGKLTGVCGCCGRALTDPDSIEAGIGPVCAKKFGV